MDNSAPSLLEAILTSLSLFVSVCEISSIIASLILITNLTYTPKSYLVLHWL